MITARGLASVVVCLALAQSATAEADTSKVAPFRSRPALELPLLGIGAALWIASDVAKPTLAPEKCRLCGDNPLDARVRERLHWAEPEAAHGVSDWLLFALVPVASLGGAFALGYAEADVHVALTDAMVVSEALVLASTLTQISKFSAARARPYARARDEQRDFVPGPDDHLSFFSGHTSATFALAVGAGATASLRGYELAPLVWGIGVPLAALTGYFRIAADRHYFTDVLAGALVGTLAGVLVPYLHARRDRPASETMPAPPAMLSLGFTH